MLPEGEAPKAFEDAVFAYHLAVSNACTPARGTDGDPLTPLEFARRARRLFGAREAVVDGDVRLDLRAILRSLRPLVGGAPAPGRTAGRPCGVHRAEHSRAARVLLCGAADRRRPGADQLPARRRRFRLHHHAQRRESRVRGLGLPGGGRRNPRPAPDGRALRRARGRPRRLARLRAASSRQSLRRAWRLRSSAPRSTKTTS